jgi:ribonucleoside-diphosphate reductase beta chain
MVRNSFDDPDKVLKEILEVSEALQRMDVVAETFSKVYDTSLALATGKIEKDQKAYEDIYMFVVAMYCLERIQFVASFAVTFAVANGGQFVQFGKAVQKICQEEFEVHQLLDRAILDYESKTQHGRLARINNKERIKKLVLSVIESEINWVEYLLSDGRELVGMTKELLKAWVLYNAKDVLQYFDIDHDYEIPLKNPIPFIEDWIYINRIQASPQEQQNGQYMLGMVMDDLVDDVIEMEL